MKIRVLWDCYASSWRCFENWELWNYVPSDAVSLCRRLESSASLLWEPQAWPLFVVIWSCCTKITDISTHMNACTVRNAICLYRGADKSLTRPDWKNNWKVTIFRPTRRSLLPRRPGWMGNLLNFFLSGLQKLEFGRCSLFPSWSG